MIETSTANASGLGKLVKEYGLSAARVRQIILVILLSAGLASACWLPALFEGNNSLTTRIAISIVGLFVAVPMFVGIYQLFRLGGNSVSLFENGLIYRRRGQEYVTTWDEISAYLEEGACRITKSDGQVIEFGLNIDGVDEVAQEVRKQTLARLLPRTKAAIEDGRTVQFKGLQPAEKWLPGKALNNFALAYAGFSVDARGITELDGGNRIGWNDIKAYGVRSEKMGRVPVDVFFVEDSQTRLRTRYGLLSNAHVLLALCADMTGLGPVDGG